MTVNCAICGRHITTTEPGVHRKVTGWTEKRKGGGANAIRMSRLHDEWACKSCVDLETSGVSARQQSFGM